MSQTIAPRLLLGFAVVAQALCFAVVVVVLAAAVAADPAYVAGGLALGAGWLVALTLAGTALCSAVLPVLVRHAQESNAVSDPERRRWLIRLALWGPVTMPVYWWRYLRSA
jgi:hypothetical protein